jgi:tetratricopeptide (TPR) repeat protein
MQPAPESRWSRIDLITKVWIFRGVLVFMIAWSLGVGVAYSQGFSLFWVPLGFGILSSIGLASFVFLIHSAIDGATDSLMGTGSQLDPAEVDAKEDLEIARRMASRREFDGALAKFKSFHSSGYDDYPARTAFSIARIYDEDLSDLHEAAAWYGKTIAAAPTDSDSPFVRDAKIGLEKAVALLKRTEGEARGQLIEVKTLIENGNEDEAETRLHDLARRHPQNEEVDYMLGVLFHARKNFGMAASHFSTTLEKDPHHVLAAYYLGVCRQDAEDYLDARRWFSNYMEMAKEDSGEAERVDEVEQRISWLNRQLDSDQHVSSDPDEEL